MNPTPSDLYVSRPLTTVSVAFMQSQANFGSTDVFPNVPVEIQGGQYWKYNREDWLRTEAQERAPSTESAGSGWNTSLDTYFSRVYAVHKDIDDQVRANATQSPFNLDRDATEWVTQQLLIKREQLWATRYFATGVWGREITGVAGVPAGGQFKQWDQTGSTPFKDVTNEIIRMAELTGFAPNTLVLSPYVANALQQHADVLDRIKYTQRGIVTNDLLATMFGVDRVIVPQAIQNTAAEGLTGAYSFIYGKSALLVYAAPRPGLLLPSAGYTFSWTGYLGATQDGLRIMRMRAPLIKSDRIEGEMAFDQKLVSSELGTFFATAVA